MRIKKKLIETELNSYYFQKEIFHYLAKVKKVRVGDDDNKRCSITTVSYITGIDETLCIRG